MEVRNALPFALFWKMTTTIFCVGTNFTEICGKQKTHIHDPLFLAKKNLARIQLFRNRFYARV